MNKLPPRLRAALGKGHAAKDVWPLVAQLEIHDVQVVVVRWQLGNPNRDEFGQREVIYQTPGQNLEARPTGGADKHGTD
jgi:hypothetical protein